MGFQRQPIWLYTLALVLFGITALLPLAINLVQFIGGCLQEPDTVRQVLIDQRQLVLLGRSLGISMLATLVALILGLPISILLVARDVVIRKAIWFLVFMTLLIPPYVITGAWLHLLSPAGLINQWMVLHFGQAAALRLQSLPGCVWSLGLSFYPITALMVGTGLNCMDRNLLDSARLSTHRWGVFRHAVWPQINPYVWASTCLVMIFVLVQYSVPSLLGMNTYPVEIFAQFSAFYNDTAAVATGLPLTLLVVVFILIQQKMMSCRDYVRLTPSSEAEAPVLLGKWKYWAVIGFLLFFLVAFVWPFSQVFIYAGGLKPVGTILQGHCDWIVYTSLLAVLAAMLSTLIGFSLGYLFARIENRFIRALNLLCWLPIAIPGTMVGLGFLKLGSFVTALQKIDSVGFLLLMAYVGMFSAFAIRVFEASFRRADPNLDEAAALDCVHWYQRCWSVDVKQHVPAILVSMVLVFVLVVGELNATVLLVPPGRSTLAVSIDNLLHYGASATASALCLIEIGVVLMVTLLGLGLAKLMNSRIRSNI